MTGYEAYKLYVALKNHFNSDSYDFFKYGGKTRASVKSFEMRHDKYFFSKLAKHKDVQRYILANIIQDNPNVWVGDLANEQRAEDNYKEWLARQESLTYTFRSDVEYLAPIFDDNFIVKEGQHPYLLKLFIHNKISIETLIIINDYCSFFSLWNKRIEEDIVWPSIHRKCVKYKPFLRYDKARLKQILVDKVSSCV